MKSKHSRAWVRPRLVNLTGLTLGVKSAPRAEKVGARAGVRATRLSGGDREGASDDGRNGTHDVVRVETLDGLLLTMKDPRVL